ncbi:unnamed protein product [Mucor hiemalis]
MSDLKEKKATVDEADLSSTNTHKNLILESTVTMVGTPSMTTAETTNGSSITSEGPYSVFNRTQKIIVVFVATCACTVSSLSAHVYLPNLLTIQKDLNTTPEMVNLTITMYMILQSVSPTFWAALADNFGRRPIYIATSSIFIVANVGLACSKNYATLLLLRMLQAVGSSSAIALGAGVIADIASPEERGGFMGLYIMGSTAGIMIGPSVGGALGHFLGWRWIFWFLAIFTASFVWIIQILFFPETLRKLVGNGSGYANPTPIQYWKKWYSEKEKREEVVSYHGSPTSGNTVIDNNEDKKKNKILDLFRSLKFLKDKDVLVILLYTAIQNGIFVSMVVSITALFINTYGVNELQLGLCFLPSGFGLVFGSIISGKVLNWRYKKVAKRLGYGFSKGEALNSEFPIERARLEITWLYWIFFNASLIAYGWSVQYKIHVAVPEMFIFLVGLNYASSFNTTNTLLVDLFPSNSAAVIACVNIPRCFIGGCAVLIVHPGIQSLGAGWFFTTLSIISILSRVTITLELKYGPQWRKDRAERSKQ